MYARARMQAQHKERGAKVLLFFQSCKKNMTFYTKNINFFGNFRNL